MGVCVKDWHALSVMASVATGYGGREGRAPATVPTDTLHPSNGLSINTGSTGTKEDGGCSPGHLLGTAASSSYRAPPQPAPTLDNGGREETMEGPGLV